MKEASNLVHRHPDFHSIVEIFASRSQRLTHGSLDFQISKHRVRGHFVFGRIYLRTSFSSSLYADCSLLFRLKSTCL